MNFNRKSSLQGLFSAQSLEMRSSNDNVIITKSNCTVKFCVLDYLSQASFNIKSLQVDFQMALKLMEKQWFPGKSNYCILWRWPAAMYSVQ